MQQITLPVTIHRSLVGVYVILLCGIVAEVIIFGGAYELAIRRTDVNVLYLLCLVGIIAMLATLIAVYVYDAAKIVLTDDGIAVTNYKTLFWSVQAVCAWTEVQDVTVNEAGILQSLSGTGVLAIETAGTKPNLALNWIPNAAYWQSFIENKAKNTPELTHNV